MTSSRDRPTRELDVPFEGVDSSRHSYRAWQPSPPPMGEVLDVPTTVIKDAPDGAHALCDLDGRLVPEPENPLPLAGDDVLFQGDFVGRYSVLSRLGRGGMGVVYKAYDPQLDRSIALKVLRPGGTIDPSTKEIRLLREAQTLAKLRHGNIVAVYDAGLTPRGVFVAMELIEGKTLGAWLDEQERRVDEIVRMFRDAGRGLAAAHEAGIVHRDFKPANVLIGDDGVARVLDFGLARLVDGGPTHDDKKIEELLRSGVSGPITDSTASGVLLGTPVYMAPEQLSGRRVDARSDQYTFCLCLHLALGGEMPDRGAAVEHIVAHISTPPCRPPRGTVPARVRRALERGLCIDPADRFSSMDALLAELAEPPRRRWKTVAATSMLGVGFAMGAMIFYPTTDPCADPEAHLQGTWGAEDRQAVRDAFLGSGHIESSELLRRVEGELDQYTRAWVETYDRSCRATHVHHAQSEQKFDRQVFCLERRRSRLDAAVDALRSIDGPRAAVERMVLPFKLPMLGDCDDLAVLWDQKPLPEDPQQRAQIEDLRRRIDYAQILDEGGESRRALELAQSALREAREVSYPPVLAEALGVLGALQASGRSVRDAEVTLKEAIRVATAAEADRTAARAWTWLIHALMYQGRYETGLELQFAAEAEVDRANDRVTKGWLLNNLGALHGRAGRGEVAIGYLEQALELKRETLGEDHFDVAISWHNLGNAQAQRGHNEEAYWAFVAAREGFERTVGDAHPMTHHAIGGLCRVERQRGKVARALALCDQMLERLEQTSWSTVSTGEMYFDAAKTQWAAGQAERSHQTARRAKAQMVGEHPERVEKIDRWLDEHPLPDGG